MNNVTYERNMYGNVPHRGKDYVSVTFFLYCNYRIFEAIFVFVGEHLKNLYTN